MREGEGLKDLCHGKGECVCLCVCLLVTESSLSPTITLLLSCITIERRKRN